MSKKLKVVIIIPCYNEMENILALFNEIKNTKYSDDYIITPVFINDCSVDHTKQLLEQNGLTHLSLSVNLGIGGAVQTGFKYALRNDFDIAVQMDGDGQHPPGELEKILQPIAIGEADIVIGSRYLTKEGFQSTTLRRIGITYFKRLIKLLVGITINDSTSGYRGFNRKAIDFAASYYPDEYPEPESIVVFTLRNLRIKETSVLMRERQTGESSIKYFSTLYYMAKVTIGIINEYLAFKLKK